ncbi:hypothetical protein V7Z35_00135 [Candidatus Carsonella ruddii]
MKQINNSDSSSNNFFIKKSDPLYNVYIEYELLTIFFFLLNL